MQTIGLIIDGVMVVLLALTIISVWVLAGRLKYIRDSRQQFEGMIRSFDESTRRADAGLKALQAAASKSGEGLQSQLDRARSLRDELSIMIESADSLARRLEAATPGKRAAASPDMGKAGDVGRAAGPDPRSKAEMDLLRAMNNPRREGGS